MSDKPQAPKSDIYGRTIYTVQYTIDGVKYFEDRSLDVANGNFLAPLGIKKYNPNHNLLGTDMFVTVDPDSEEGKRVLNSMVRRNKLVDFAQDWVNNDDETLNAAVESGYIDYAREGENKDGEYKSFINEDVPNPEKNAEDAARAKSDALEAEAQIFQESIQVKKENLYYPNNLASLKGEDYIFIEQFEYSPPQPSGTVKPGEILKTGVPRTTNIEEPRGTCRLPIPNKLGVSNGVSWGEAKANAIELAAFDAAAGGIGGLIGGEKNIGELLQKGFGSGGKILEGLREDFNNTTGSQANAASVISATLAKSVLSSIGINVDVDQFITRQTGAAINPNLELLFGGPQLRTFSFNFNFAPENSEEASMVRKIQRWFRQGMLPTRSLTTGDRNLFLGSPNVFRITYKNKSRRIKGLNIIKICALTACQIDFTPDGTYQSYDDDNAVSMPVRSTMGLTFNELTPIFKDDYATFDGVPYKDNRSQSTVDLGSSITGQNTIDENDIGF